MKQTLICITLLLSVTALGYSQNSKPKNPKSLNLGFEKLINGHAKGWKASGNPNYNVSLDSTIVHKGKYSISITSGKGSPKYKALFFTLPKNFAGKKITLSGFIKTKNVSDGYAGLWMKIDPKIAFNNMHDKGVTGTTGWRKYKITLKMKPSHTQDIVVGGLLTGKGKMWLDQLKITIDGKDISKAKVYLKPAAKDSTFDHGSGITVIKTDSTTINNLKILGLVWGFVKYYHPNVANGEYNWDYELFRILPKILSAKNGKQRDEILVHWIKNLGDFPEGNDGFKAKNIKMKPDLSWITSSAISNKLSKLLLKIKNAKRSNLNYYIGYGRSRTPIFKHEAPYKYMKYPDAGFRLLALYRYWNIIQYFYPYRYLIPDWKDILTDFIPKFIDAKNQPEYTLTALKLIAHVHDTHANIWQNPTLKKYFGKRYAVPKIIFINNKAVVKGFYKEKTEKETVLKKGDIITEINGEKVSKIIKQSLKITPASNYSTQLRNLAFKLLRTNNDHISITYLHNGKRKRKLLKTYPLKKLNIYKKVSPDTSFKIITPDIAYLYLGTIKPKALPSIFKKIKHTKGLIIDLRCYPTWIIYDLGKYLMPKKTKFTKFSYGSIKHPGLFTFGKTLTIGQKNKNYYKGKVVILVNAKTQSRAEFTTMALMVAPNAVVIGSTTAGADGDVTQFYLPGGILTSLTYLGVYYPDGGETQRVGIVPDIVVKPTVKDIRNGKDAALEKAIEIINQQ